jgi:hypothetical protein
LQSCLFNKINQPPATNCGKADQVAKLRV